MRVQLRRTKGWRKPAWAVSVARPGPFGNPYRAEKCVGGWAVYDRGCLASEVHRGFLSRYEFRDNAIRRAIELYRYWINHTEQVALRNRIRATFALSTGKVPACWCPLDSPCHADVILEVANTPMEG